MHECTHACKTGCDGMDMYCKRKTMIGCKNVWSMKRRIPDLVVDQRGLGERLCKKTVKHINCTKWMLWIVVDGEADHG